MNKLGRFLCGLGALGIMLVFVGIAFTFAQADIRKTTDRRAPEVHPKTDVVTINERNSVSFDQVFTDDSVGQAMADLQRISDGLNDNETIYLVLNSPGGSVFAGLQLIAFAQALPQKVKTITIFAASMAFHTVQNLDERLILPGGTLMSHPPSFGVSGQSPYQVKSRLNWILGVTDDMDAIAAERMSLSFKTYQDLIHDEYWIHGSRSVKEHAADRVVVARCGTYSKATKTTTVQTLFGAFDVELPSCPLVPGIIGVKPSGGGKTADSNAYEYVRLMFTDKISFTKTYITTNAYQAYQR